MMDIALAICVGSFVLVGVEFVILVVSIILATRGDK